MLWSQMTSQPTADPSLPANQTAEDLTFCSEEARSSQAASSNQMLPISQGQCSDTPQTGPIVGSAHQCQAMNQVSGYVLDDEDRDFLSNCIRKGTK